MLTPWAKPSEEEQPPTPTSPFRLHSWVELGGVWLSSVTCFVSPALQLRWVAGYWERVGLQSSHPS